MVGKLPPFTVVPPSEPLDGDDLERLQSGKLIRLPVITSLDLDPKVILQAAIDADLDGCIIIGYTKGDPELRNTKDEYFASSIAAGDVCVWLMNRYIYKMMKMSDEEWDGEPPIKGAG